MTEIVRIRNPKGGWMPVTFLAFGEGQISGGTVQGILVQVEENTLPRPVEARDVHPDDFKGLVERFAQSKD